jgi:mannose-6-phosphate isomerase-like protein (cupin superfamily)
LETLMAAGAPFVGRRVEKPWGFEIIWAETDRYVGKVLHIEAGHQLSYQYHERKDETICVLRGLLQLEVATVDGDRQVLRLAPGQSFRIFAGLRHRLLALETCEIVEASSPELDDIVRLEDRYGRVPR